MSYDLDSRNENVELNYNALKIASPTAFTKSVDFSGSPGVVGLTWPRGIRAFMINGAYVGNTIANPFTATSFDISGFGGNTFNSLVPSLTYTDYFTVANLTGLITILAEGFYYINALFNSDATLTAGDDASCSIRLNASPFTILATGFATNTAGGTDLSYKNIQCSCKVYFAAGTVLQTTYFASTPGSHSITLILTIIKER